MKLKTVFAVIACLAVTLQAHATQGQYLPRQGGESGLQRQRLQSDSAGLGMALVTYLDGDSLLMSADDEDWTALSPNLSLRVGDRVWVQDGSRAEVRFPLGATAWVNYQSELDVTSMEAGTRADTIQLALVSGEAAFDVKSLARTGSVFQVDIPNAAIRVFRAARFRVNTLPDGTEQIGVISGSLVLETPEGLTDVSAGRMAEVQPDRRIVMDFLPQSDEWDDWVRSRADRYDRPSASARHLPQDLSAYAHEFDNSGRWTNDRTHGSIWVPSVAPGWSPYSNGRWVWQANDYVWLGYDPWYAPFHYGRWNWAVSIGWFWTAPRGRSYWSPGYVGWSVDDDVVSWVPLGRDEIYYGYGNYGPANVNVYKTTNINVTNVYINSRVTNGVFAVKRDNFLRGRIVHERIAPRRNPFERSGTGRLRILARPPVQEIKPIRETRHPRPEVEIRRVSLPPERVDQRSRKIRERVAAPTKDKSVFKPGKAPAKLKNIVKEKELEQWVPPKKASAAKVRKTPDHPERERAPAGKHRFKRVTETKGEAEAVTDPEPERRERSKDDDEKQSPGDERGNKRER